MHIKDINKTKQTKYSDLYVLLLTLYVFMYVRGLLNFLVKF